MTEDPSDVFDLLRLGDPAKPAELPNLQSDMAARIRAKAIASPGSTQSRTPVTKPVRIAALVAVAVLVAAATWAFTREPSDPSTIICYQDTNLESSADVPARTDQFGPLRCAESWSTRVLTNPRIVAAGGIPPLLACVSNDGVMVVFPTDDASECARLGLADYEIIDSDSPLTESQDLQESLDEIFLGVVCPDLAGTEADLRLLLRDFGGWELELVGPATLERPCVGYSTDFETKTLWLVPEQKRN